MLILYFVLGRVDQSTQDIDGGQRAHIENEVRTHHRPEAALRDQAQHTAKDRYHTEGHSGLTDGELLAEGIHDQDTKAHGQAGSHGVDQVIIVFRRSAQNDGAEISAQIIARQIVGDRHHNGQSGSHQPVFAGEERLDLPKEGKLVGRGVLVGGGILQGDPFLGVVVVHEGQGHGSQRRDAHKTIPVGRWMPVEHGIIQHGTYSKGHGSAYQQEG